MKIAIEASNLNKTFSLGRRIAPKVALDDVSFGIAEGEAFGFIGQNGAGKSTLIKILVGALRASGGSATLFGVEVEDARARKGMGYVPENPSLQEYLTPLETLMMAVRLHGVQVSDEREHCLKWLARFDLSAVANRPIRGFSKGMVQRTALAHAMVVEPRLLILDEPLSGLDPVGRKDVVDILDAYRRDGGTLFFSSHVLYDVERIADRCGLIHRGRLVAIRTPREVIAEQAGHYFIRYHGEKAVPGAHEVQAGLFSLQATDADLESIIANVRSIGGVVRDVLPVASLESVFFRAISVDN